MTVRIKETCKINGIPSAGQSMNFVPDVRGAWHFTAERMFIRGTVDLTNTLDIDTETEDGVKMSYRLDVMAFTMYTEGVHQPYTCIERAQGIATLKEAE